MQQIDRVVEVVEEALKGNVVRFMGQRTRPSLDLPKATPLPPPRAPEPGPPADPAQRAGGDCAHQHGVPQLLHLLQDQARPGEALELRADSHRGAGQDGDPGGGV